jgi:hypothetical protein
MLKLSLDDMKYIEKFAKEAASTPAEEMSSLLYSYFGDNYAFVFNKDTSTYINERIIHYRQELNKPMELTAENIPVGIMATMIQDSIKEVYKD